MKLFGIKFIGLLVLKRSYFDFPMFLRGRTHPTFKGVFCIDNFYEISKKMKI